MKLVFCAALFSFGFVIRDGWPALGSTTAARIFGALICGVGGAVISPALGVAAILSMLAGFYSDHDHATGQQAVTPRDAGYLLVSGFTSLVPLLVFVVAWNWPNVLPCIAVVALLMLSKPAIWFLSREALPHGSFTRLAAAVFGAVIGAVFFLIT